MPNPRLDCTDAAFKFNFKWMSAMLSYSGVLIIGSIVGNGNPSTIFLIDDGILGGGDNVINN